jgi:outer membrane immunogenic protein
MTFDKLSRWIVLWVLALAVVLPISYPAYAAGQSPTSPEAKMVDQGDVVLVALPEPSSAAANTAGSNMPAPPPAGSSARWDGPYIGINVGYGSGNADTFFNPLPSATMFFVLLPQTLHPNPSGLVGGGQIGYNHQHNHLVVGVEGDINGSTMSGTKIVTPIIQNNNIPFPSAATPCTACFLSAHQDTPWFLTARGRLGFAVSHVLLYGTFGMIDARVNNSAVTNFTPVGTTIYKSAPNQTKVGWTGGGGAEFAVGGRWSLKGEYLHCDLGTVQNTANPQISLPPFQVAYTWQVRSNLIRFGLNYKF